jgi:hypothetical protein
MTRAPLSRIGRVNAPVPAPISRTRSPEQIPALSTSRSAHRLSSRCHPHRVRCSDTADHREHCHTATIRHLPVTDNRSIFGFQEQGHAIGRSGNHGWYENDLRQVSDTNNLMGLGTDVIIRECSTGSVNAVWGCCDTGMHPRHLPACLAASLRWPRTDSGRLVRHVHVGALPRLPDLVPGMTDCGPCEVEDRRWRPCALA